MVLILVFYMKTCITYSTVHRKLIDNNVAQIHLLIREPIIGSPARLTTASHCGKPLCLIAFQVTVVGAGLLETAMTSWPPFTRLPRRVEPMNPLAPPSKTFIVRSESDTNEWAWTNVSLHATPVCKSQ
jgi:hypothetical protein